MLLLLAMLLLSSPAFARDVVECSAGPGGSNAYWSWREIDGRKCWYVGRPGKPKSELYWRATRTPSEASVQRAGQLLVAPAADPVPQEAPVVLKAEDLQTRGIIRLLEQPQEAAPQVQKAAPPPQKAASPPQKAAENRMPIWALASAIFVIVGALFLLPFLTRSKRRMQWLNDQK